MATAFKHAPRLDAHVKLVDRHIAALRARWASRRHSSAPLSSQVPLLVPREQSRLCHLPSCILEGASTTLPFICPLESLDVARDLARIRPSGRGPFSTAASTSRRQAPSPLTHAQMPPQCGGNPTPSLPPPPLHPRRLAAGALDGSSGAMMVQADRASRALRHGAASRPQGGGRGYGARAASRERRGRRIWRLESIDTATRFHRLIMDALVGG